jgi:hypothetical protein
MLGLAGAVAVWLVWGDASGRRSTVPPPTGPVLAECEGPLRDLVIQYLPEAAAVTATTYRQFLTQLPTGVTVHVVCPDRAAFADLAQRVGATACRLEPLCTGHAMTTWARDRWLALAPFAEAGPGHDLTTILCPGGEEGADHWPQRRGDQLIGRDLAGALGATLPGARVECRTSGLDFDGGDFAADADTVFVTPAVARRNVQHTVATRDGLATLLRALLGKRMVLLDPAPDHHVGMYMMVTGGHTVVVGDPAWARRLLADATSQPATASADGAIGAGLCPPQGPDWSANTQALYDAVARQCAAEGYRVVRIPVVPGVEARCVVTYVNVITDVRAGRRIIYMPVYRGAEALNDVAAEVWRGLGCTVRPIDCTLVYPHFGSLHCLVNVLRRG